MFTIRILQFIFFSTLPPITLTTTTLHPGPVGILRCRQICLYTIGCEIYTYLPDHLSCLNGNFSNILKSRMEIRRLKEPKPDDQHHCQTWARAFRTRTDRQVCREEKKLSNGSEATSVLSNDQLKTLGRKGYHQIEKEGTIYLYTFYQDLVSWEKAMKRCKEDGGLLAQFQEAFKFDLLPKSIVESLTSFAWVGLSDQRRNDKYVWLDGTELKDKKLWTKGFLIAEPNHIYKGLEENCAKIYYSTFRKRYYLNDAQCWFKAHFLCEVVSKRT